MVSSAPAATRTTTRGLMTSASLRSRLQFGASSPFLCDNVLKRVIAAWQGFFGLADRVRVLQLQVPRIHHPRLGERARIVHSRLIPQHVAVTRVAFGDAHLDRVEVARKTEP